MKFINTKEELFRDIANHNSKTDRNYSIVIDTKFSRELYKSFENVRGLAAFPYTDGENIFMLYFINNANMVDTVIAQRDSITSDKHLALSEMKLLIKRRVVHFSKLFGKQYLIQDLKTFIEKGYIESDEFLRKRNANHSTKISEILSKVNLDNIEIEDRYLVIKGQRYHIKDVLDAYETPKLYFKVIEHFAVADKNEIRNYLDKKYIELVLLAENIPEDIESIDDFNSLNTFVTTMFDVKTVIDKVGAEGVNSLCVDLFNFLENNKLNKLVELNTKLLYTAVQYRKLITGLKIDRKSLSFAKSLSTNNAFEGITHVDTEVTNANDLNLIVYNYNIKFNHKLYIDYNLSRDLYKASLKIPGVAFNLLYLKDMNKFVMVYQASSNVVLKLLIAKADNTNKKLNLKDLESIGHSEIKEYSYLVFKSQAIMSLVHLYKFGKLKSDTFVAEVDNNRISNLSVLLKKVKLSDIVVRGDATYIKLEGIFKLPPFPRVISYSEGKYFTTLKIMTNDSTVLDNVLEGLICIPNLENSNELLEISRVLYERLIRRLPLYKNSKSKWLKDFETYKHIYELSIKSAVKSSLVTLFDDIKNKTKDYKEVNDLRHLVKVIN